MHNKDFLYLLFYPLKDSSNDISILSVLNLLFRALALSDSQFAMVYLLYKESKSKLKFLPPFVDFSSLIIDYKSTYNLIIGTVAVSITLTFFIEF